jgi:hypothetical protein
VVFFFCLGCPAFADEKGDLTRKARQILRANCYRYHGQSTSQDGSDIPTPHPILPLLCASETQNRHTIEIVWRIRSVEERVMTPQDSQNDLTEDRRREIFLALVDAQDHDMTVPQSRQSVASRFGLSEGQVRKIEREGLDNNWPPL